MKKSMLWLLACFFVFAGCSSFEKSAENVDSFEAVKITDSGFQVLGENTEILCDIEYENGLKLNQVLLPITGIVADDSEGNDVLFSDFQISFTLDQEFVMRFHDGNQVNINGTELNVSQIEFNPAMNYSDQSQKALLTGENLPLEVFLLPSIESIEVELGYHGIHKNVVLTLKTEQIRNSFVEQIKTAVAKDSVHPEDVIGCPYTLMPEPGGGQDIDPLTVRIKDHNGYEMVWSVECEKSFIVNDSLISLGQDELLIYFTNLLRDRLFYLHVPTKYYEEGYRVYLKPKHYEDEDILIVSDDEDPLWWGSINLEDLMFGQTDLVELGMKAYENGTLIDELPQDTEEHLIDLVDEKGNVYQIQYRNGTRVAK